MSRPSTICRTRLYKTDRKYPPRGARAWLCESWKAILVNSLWGIPLILEEMEDSISHGLIRDQLYERGCEDAVIRLCEMDSLQDFFDFYYLLVLACLGVGRPDLVNACLLVCISMYPNDTERCENQARKLKAFIDSHPSSRRDYFVQEVAYYFLKPAYYQEAWAVELVYQVFAHLLAQHIGHIFDQYPGFLDEVLGLGE